MAKRAKRADYFGNPSPQAAHAPGVPGQASTVPSSRFNEISTGARYGKRFQVGIDHAGKVVHLYANGTRVVLNKHPSTDHPLYKAAMRRVRAGG